MKNRVLAMILCLVMLLGMLPMSAVAEGEEPEAHVHTSHEGWTAVSGTKLPTTSGNYYLSEDMELTAVAEIASAQEIVLCLNGKTVDCTATKRAYRLCKGANLTICDCTAETKDGVYTAGRIKKATNTAIMIGTETPGAILNIHDGIFEDNTISGAGAVIVAQGGSKVNIHNGAFLNNKAGTNAGAIYANNTTVKVYGGTFSGNSAKSAGGVFYVSNGNLQLHGGTIRENTAAHGGAVFVQNNSGIVLNGVTITENTAATRGGGIDYTGNGTLTVGGTTKIIDNKVGEQANNIVLVNGRKLQLDEASAPLQTGAEIGVSVCTWGSDNVPDYSMGASTVFATNATQEDADQYFKVDRVGTGHSVQLKNETLRFALPKEEHPVENYHTEETWTEWTQTTTLPTISGHYYLTGDVDVTVAAGVTVNTQQNIVLCLNGYTVTGANRIYRLSKGANVTICDCTSYYNESGEFIAGKLVPGTSEGGAIGLFGDGANETASTLTLKNILIDGTGKQNANGGAIQLGYAGANVVIEDCIIRNCTTTGRGGAIQNHSGVLKITNSLLTDNTAKYGGAVMVQNNSQTTLTDVTITDNTASVYGGGINSELTANGTGFLKVEGNTVIQNNFNSKTKHDSNVNLLNQARRVTIGALGENASVGIIAEKSTDSSDLVTVTISEQATEDALKHFTSDMGHEVVLEGTALKIRGRAHTAHATDECGHSSVTWTATNTLPTTTGHYYLTSNVTVASAVGGAYNTGAEVTICLNGYSIIGAEGCRLFRMSNGTVLNICDCTGHGKLTGGSNANGGVAWIGKDGSDASGGTLNLYGGIATGNTTANDKALFFVSNGNLTVAGGEISGNQARAVLLQNGSFTMTGGKISGNEFHAGDGVAVRVTGGSFTMTGGEISDNVNNKNGGAIRIDKGTALLSGGRISGNTTVNAAGLLLTGGKTTLEGVEITNNTANGNGGGLYIMGTAEVVLNGAVITGNTAGKAGAGIYHSGAGTLKVGGNTKVTDNTVAGRASNLQLLSGTTFCVGTMTEGAVVGITGDLQKMTADGKLAVGTDAAQTDAATYFTGDQNMDVEQQDSTLYLTLRADAQHTDHAPDTCGHSDAKWQFWADGTSLPTAEGHYYLTNNVTLGALGGAIYNTGAEVTICLNGFTISGAGTGRAFRLSNGSVLNICDCTGNGQITNCNNNKAGVAWIGMDAGDTAPGTLNLYGGKVTDCNAGMDSALFHVEGGSFTMHDGVITENNSRILFINQGTAEIHGGKIINNTFGLRDGGVLRMPDGSFTMTGGQISGNVNEGFSGTLRVDNGSATITGGKISGNKAVNGAAIIMAGGKLSVTDTELSDNEAKSSGGAIYLFGEVEAYLGKGTVISGNKAGNNAGGIYTQEAKITMEDVTVTGNTAAKTGGGMFFTYAEATMTRVAVTKNTAETGGGVVSGRTNKLTVTDCSISGNTATNAGGGLLIQSAADVTLSDSKISGNSAVNNGGGVYVSYDGTLNMKSGTIEGNTAKGFGGGVYLADQMNMSGGSISGNYAKKEGGGIYITEGSRKDADGKTVYNAAVFNMIGGSISYNSTDVNGAGVCVRGQKGLFNLYGGTISNNTATNTKSGTGHGGGVLAQGKGTFYMYGGTIRDNAATTAGGGIRIAPNSGFSIYGGTISGNTAYRGAGVYAEEDFVFEKCTVTGNTAANEGGGVYVSGCKMTMNSGTISNNQIADKNADGIPDGSSGGMTVRANAECTMNGGQIIGNLGKHAGGVVVQSGGIFTMNDGLIAENKAEGGYGGGLYNSRSTVQLLGGIFRGNVSSHAGGAIYTDGVFTADGCEFTENVVTATSGGICSGGAVKTGQKASIALKNCKFTNNTVMGRGGAVDISYKSSGLIVDCTFTGNTASANGGAIGLYTVGVLDVEGCVFNGNTAMGSGGAVSSESTSIMRFTDTTFESNKGASGGAVYVAAITQAEFLNCTLTGNTGNRFGSAIYANGGVKLTDTAITGQLGKAHAVTITADGSDGESFMTGISQFAGNVIIADNEGGGLELLEGAFVNIHGDGLSEQAKILVTQAQGGITGNIFGAYDYVRQGDVYTLTKGDLALCQADPVTVVEEEAEVPETTGPEALVTPPSNAKKTVLIIFGSLLAVSAVLIVAAVLAVKKMKKRNAAEQK